MAAHVVAGRSVENLLDERLQRSSNARPIVQRKPLPDDDHDFLAKLQEHGKPIIHLDADGRARKIVKKWKGKEFDLIRDQKIALIEQMLSGFTLNLDESAILDLLESMTPSEREELTSRRRTSMARLKRKMLCENGCC